VKDEGNKGQVVKIRCAKCSDECDESRCRVAEAKAFFFCQFCDLFLDDHPHLSVRDYLGHKFEGKVSESIRKAHKNRTQGKSPWDSQQPERSKREDFPIKNAPDLKTSSQGMGMPSFNYVVDKEGKIGKMRCSEHCGNTVRDK
jgi:hypothetical protein